MTTGHEILKPYSMPDDMREQVAAAIDKEIAKAKEEQREATAKWYDEKGWLLDESEISAAILNNKDAMLPSEEVTQIMNDMQILPCPFCGGRQTSDGEVMTHHVDGRITTQSECLVCGALGPEAELNEGEMDYGNEKAISAWNRRI